MQEWLNSNGGVMAVVAVVVVSLNILLSAVSVVLDKLDAVIPGDSDKKVNDLVKKALGVLSKIVDWVGGNKEHK